MSPWPLPVEYQHGSSAIFLSLDVNLEYKVVRNHDTPTSWQKLKRLHGNPARPKVARTTPLAAEATLRSAFERFKSATFAEKFVPYKFFPRGVEFEPEVGQDRVFANLVTIEKHEIPQGESFHGLDEEYSLDMSADGEILIKVTSYLGGLHALTSLAQLFYTHSSDESIIYSPLAPVTIRDRPLFSHRGFNLDICRNRISPKDVIRTIDGMSFAKMNVLHLHATDSQSWPLEIPALPDLAAKGAYHKSQIWSKEDLKAVQEYGAGRGVEIYVEIDMPGHTGSVFHAYPDLVTAYDQRPWTRWAAEPPSGQLKLNYPPVRDFLSSLLNDLLPRSSNNSSFFHIGGDEFNVNVYELDENVRSSSKEVIRPYYQEFVNHVMGIVSSYSLTPIAWEEMLLEWNLKMPQSAVIQIWRSHSAAIEVVAKGYYTIVGPCTHWYLDSGYGAWVDPDPNNPDSPIKPPFLDWNGPYKSWRQVYSYDPLSGIEERDSHLVLGGEAHLWGELTDSVNLDHMIWPRLAAVAEVLWKGKCTVSEDATRRLAELRERLVGRGFTPAMVQMEWCLANPGGSRT